MARRVLITGARAAAALDLARAFVAAGWRVHMADCVAVRMARWSRLAVHHHRYPAPRQNAAAFRAEIAGLVERHAIDLVVPTCEEVFHLAAPALHEQLGTKLYAPDLPTLRMLHDKFAFAQRCQTWGLSAPESHALDDAEALDPFLPASRDWVFKPRFSRFGDRTLVGPDAERLARSRPAMATGWMAQRRIAGDEACFHAMAHQGRLTAFAAYGSTWRLGGGASYAFEPLAESRAESLRELAQALAERVSIHGQFACDAIFDRDGRPWLIECNPRATSGVHLLTAQAGIVAAIADGAELGAAGVQPPAYLGPAMWVFGLPLALRKGRLREWREILAEGHDVISRTGDRAPALGALVDAAAFSLKGLLMGISTNAASTCDIEWNGEEMD